MTAAPMTATNASRSADRAPRRGLPRDPLGLIAGFRAFRLYSELSALSDSALAARGLTRADLPRVAFDRAFAG